MSILTDIAAQAISSERTVVNIVAVDTQLCTANAQRYAIGFSIPVADNRTITTAPNDPALGGFQITTGLITWLTVKDHGSLAQKEWWARANGGALTITIWEIVFPKE